MDRGKGAVSKGKSTPHSGHLKGRGRCDSFAGEEVKWRGAIWGASKIFMPNLASKCTANSRFAALMGRWLEKRGHAHHSGYM